MRSAEFCHSCVSGSLRGIRVLRFSTCFARELYMDTYPPAPAVVDAEIITCASCKACCCKLEVMLMSEDEIPQRFIEVDRWGGRIMKRLDDGWCAALDRDTMLCSIYERRPAICRDFPVGESDCIAERVQLTAQIVWRK